jgi:hypothetical protein
MATRSGLQKENNWVMEIPTEILKGLLTATRLVKLKLKEIQHPKNRLLNKMPPQLMEKDSHSDSR